MRRSCHQNKSLCYEKGSSLQQWFKFCICFYAIKNNSCFVFLALFLSIYMCVFSIYKNRKYNHLLEETLADQVILGNLGFRRQVSFIFGVTIEGKVIRIKVNDISLLGFT